MILLYFLQLLGDGFDLELGWLHLSLNLLSPKIPGEGAACLTTSVGILALVWPQRGPPRFPLSPSLPLCWERKILETGPEGSFLRRQASLADPGLGT